MIIERIESTGEVITDILVMGSLRCFQAEPIQDEILGTWTTIWIHSGQDDCSSFRAPKSGRLEIS